MQVRRTYWEKTPCCRVERISGTCRTPIFKSVTVGGVGRAFDGNNLLGRQTAGAVSSDVLRQRARCAKARKEVKLTIRSEGRVKLCRVPARDIEAMASAMVEANTAEYLAKAKA